MRIVTFNLLWYGKRSTDLVVVRLFAEWVRTQLKNPDAQSVSLFIWECEVLDALSLPICNGSGLKITPIWVTTVHHDEMVKFHSCQTVAVGALQCAERHPPVAYLLSSM